MEIELQNEVQETERELSPQEHLRALWNQQTGIPFWRQKSTAYLRPELLPYASVVHIRGWSSPRAFALQGLAVAAILLSLINWYATHDAGPRRDQIQALHSDLETETARQQGIMDATQRERNRIAKSNQVFKSLSKEEAVRQMDASIEDSKKSLEEFAAKNAEKEKELYATQQAEAVANSGTPLVFSLALVFAAGWIAAGLRRDFPRGNVRAAGDLYLYLATAEGIWFNLVFLVLLHFALSGNAYGLTGFSSTIGPLFWLLFWVAFYLLFVRYLGLVSRDMYKAMQIPSPGSGWNPENRMLMRLHNSFLIVFAALEIMFLSLSYLFYVIMRRFA
ncbi:MAG TPA: hypothetical protein VKW06_04285 [Candidatus Angelobacter sp.]|nr:hypothetical protein [Candidatus Angelobacter sp.]